MRFDVLLIMLCLLATSCTQRIPQGTAVPLKDGYVKREVLIAMRDGVKLFTAIYQPRDSSAHYPILMVRTPYSCYPYGESNIRQQLGPGRNYATEKYIFVYQDVRGRYMSEGKFEEMTPHIDHKKTKNDVDESSDTYDTIEWLLHNVNNHNGKVGLYGISYPGFYATASLPNAHPAIKAVSPQAPVTDEFEGDDAYHRGAFFLMDNYNFLNGFDYPREKPANNYPRFCTQNIGNAYEYFLAQATLKNASKCFNNKSKIWNEYLQHDTKDEYWQARDIRQHLKNIKPAVLVVGGWFDAENLFGALNTYKAIENQSPKNENSLLMGPWTHGAWAAPGWSSFGSLNFGKNVNEYYHQVEFNFFKHYLKGDGGYKKSEAIIFFTGSNEWKTFDAWPPRRAKESSLYFGGNKLLSFSRGAETGYEEYESDPANPVPYINNTGGRRNDTYMIADQSFASRRSDVLSFSTLPLADELVLAGPITANLFVSTTGTDADFVGKLIEVMPDTTAGKTVLVERLVRAEILRGKFRNSYSKPEPFIPNQITPVKLVLNDVAHEFRKGSRIMVQVQSSWFPLVDRNPQQFMRIPEATEKDFKKATIRLYHDAQHPSSIRLTVLK